MNNEEQMQAGGAPSPSSGAGDGGSGAVLPLKAEAADAGSQACDKGVKGEIAVQHILERYLTRYPDSDYRL